MNFSVSSRFGPTGCIARVFALAAGEVLVQAKWAIMGIPLFPTANRFEVLDRAIEAAPPEGLWLEFGVWKGESLDYLAQKTQGAVYGFDSFEGLPSNWGVLGIGLRRGAFATTPPSGLRANVRLVPGRFEHSLPAFLTDHPGESAAFVHIDCDLYLSAKAVLSALAPRIVPGTVLVFDDSFAESVIGNDESRAWAETTRNYRIRARWITSSASGSVAAQVVKVDHALDS